MKDLEKNGHDPIKSTPVCHQFRIIILVLWCTPGFERYVTHQKMEDNLQAHCESQINTGNNNKECQSPLGTGGGSLEPLPLYTALQQQKRRSVRRRGSVGIFPGGNRRDGRREKCLSKVLLCQRHLKKNRKNFACLLYQVVGVCFRPAALSGNSLVSRQTCVQCDWCV